MHKPLHYFLAKLVLVLGLLKNKAEVMLPKPRQVLALLKIRQRFLHDPKPPVFITFAHTHIRKERPQKHSKLVITEIRLINIATRLYFVVSACPHLAEDERAYIYCPNHILVSLFFFRLPDCYSISSSWSHGLVCNLWMDISWP